LISFRLKLFHYPLSQQAMQCWNGSQQSCLVAIYVIINQRSRLHWDNHVEYDVLVWKPRTVTSLQFRRLSLLVFYLMCTSRSYNVMPCENDGTARKMWLSSVKKNNNNNKKTKQKRRKKQQQQHTHTRFLRASIMNNKFWTNFELSQRSDLCMFFDVMRVIIWMMSIVNSHSS